MSMSIPLRSLTLAALALASGMAAAHDGALTADGCHHDGKGYHCHRRDASPQQSVQHVAPDELGSSLDDTSGESARRNCTTAMLACGSSEATAPGTGPLSAMGKIGEEERGMNARLEAGGAGLLVVLAVLFVLSLYIIRGVHGRRS
jgi:hypothetical protein